METYDVLKLPQVNSPGHDVCQTKDSQIRETSMIYASRRDATFSTPRSFEKSQIAQQEVVLQPVAKQLVVPWHSWTRLGKSVFVKYATLTRKRVGTEIHPFHLTHVAPHLRNCACRPSLGKFVLTAGIPSIVRSRKSQQTAILLRQVWILMWQLDTIMGYAREGRSAPPCKGQ